MSDRISFDKATGLRLISMLYDWEKNSKRGEIFDSKSLLNDQSQRVLGIVKSDEDGGEYNVEEARLLGGAIAVLDGGRKFDDTDEGFGFAKHVNELEGIEDGKIVELFLLYDDDDSATWYFEYQEPFLDNADCEPGEENEAEPVSVLIESSLDTNKGSTSYLFRQLVEAAAPSSDQIAVPVIQDVNCIKIGPIKIADDGSYDDDIVLPSHVGDNRWIQVITAVLGGLSTVTITHIGPDSSNSNDIVINNGDTLNIDNTGHVIGVNGTPIPYPDPDPPIQDECKDIFIDDGDPIRISGTEIANNEFELISGGAITLVTENIEYRSGFEIVDDVAAPEAGYDGKAWVIAGHVKENGSNVKIDLGGAATGTLTGTVVIYDTTKHGKDKTDILSFAMLIPPTGWGNSLLLCSLVPVGTLCDNISKPIADIACTVIDADPDATTIDVTSGDPISFDQYYFIDDALGNQFPQAGSTPVGRFQLNFQYLLMDTDGLEARLVDIGNASWDELTGAPIPAGTFWGHRDQRTVEGIDLTDAGKTIVLEWKVFDSVFGDFIPKLECSKTWTLISGDVCWSDDFEDPNLFDSKWTENNTNGTNTVTGGQLLQALAASAGTAIIESKMPDTSDSWLFSENYSSVALPAVSNLIKQVLVVVNTKTYEVGYIRDNATAQQFAVIVNGSIKFQEDDAGSGLVSIERGDFQLSDDFSGSGQNSTSETGGIFLSRWTTDITSGGGDDPVIVGNALKMQVSSTTGVSGRAIDMDTLPDGGFIEFVFSNLSFGTNNASGKTANFRLDNGIGGFVQIYMNIRDGASGNVEVTTNSNTEGVNIIEVDNSTTNATMRIERSGDDFIMKLDGNTKDTITNAALATSVNQRARTEAAVMSAVDSAAYDLDSISIDSGSGDIQDIRALFKKAGNLEFAESDDSSNVTAANVVLNSVDSVTYTAISEAHVAESPIGVPYCTE